MISIKIRDSGVAIKYVTLHGNAFSLKAFTESAFPKQYRMLKQYVRGGIYKNEILDILASIFSVSIKDKELVNVLLKGTEAEIEKLRVSE